MRSLFLLSVLLVGVLCNNMQEQLLRDLYNQWKVNHDKVYATTWEDEFRFDVFSQNYLSILEFNAQDDSVNLVLNHFADLTTEEFGALYTGGRFTKHAPGQGNFHVFENIQDPPANVDWRTQGAVTPVKNQGTCGSCWAFSATGALEGLYFLNNSKLLSFSEQNLVDCVKADAGCNGGLPTDAFDYTAQNSGIETEDDYPYEGRDEECRYAAAKGVDVNTAYVNVTPQNVEQMKYAVAAQPVSVGIQANQLVFQFYGGGVIKNFCGDTLDHGVLVVGYGQEKGQDAFIVKNSWGATWGNAGYVYISTNGKANDGNGVCGILSVPAIPTQDK